jgi:Mrp family chromosome partitioning ATPase
MSESCSHNCSECSDECNERESEKKDFSEKPHELSNIKKVIGIVSSKGGVGKSLITSMLAVLMNRNGYNTAILDADVTGPSIPKAFGLKQKASGSELGLFPVKSKTGIGIMSPHKNLYR